MAWTQADLDKIERLIGLGSKRIKTADKETEFMDFEDLVALRDKMKNELNGTSSINERMVMGGFVSTLNPYCQ